MAKLVTDWVKTATVLPKWSPPLIAFLSSVALMTLLMMAVGIGINAQLSAQAIILSLISTAVAIGSTVLQSRANPSTDTVKSQQQAQAQADADAAAAKDRADMVARIQAEATAALVMQKIQAAMASTETVAGAGGVHANP